MNCHACGAALTSTARFCHKCGAQLGGGQAAGWRAGLPWGVAGAEVGALITLIALRMGAGSREPGEEGVSSTAPRYLLPAHPTPPAPAITQTPSLATDPRLFN